MIKNEHKTYLIYLDAADGSNSSDDKSSWINDTDSSLKKTFRENVMRLNSSNCWVVKVPQNDTMSNIMERCGLSNSGKNRGIVVEFVNSHFSGWYSTSLWEFIRQPIEEAIKEETEVQDEQS